MTSKEIMREWRMSTKLVRREPDPVVIEDVGHLRIATAVRVSATVIRVTMPRRKTTK
jgi:hypothetical protein